MRLRPDAKDYIGKPKGIKQILYERGLYVKGMTQKGKKKKAADVEDAPTRWKAGDIVLRNEGPAVDLRGATLAQPANSFALEPMFSFPYSSVGHAGGSAHLDLHSDGFATTSL